ncbi:MAG: DUF1993 domain-containing protein [Rhodospirillaceae bacterium]|nr:MAG: DUF1993 domain-containing protein [Rhodospirillaceae bacterium]
MAISLYDATVPNFLQLLSGLRGVLDKGLAHAKASGLDPNTLAEAKLIDDMFPLYLQIRRVADHSSGALMDVSKGAFTMPKHDPLDYAGLQSILADAETAVRGWTRETVNALEGREVILNFGNPVSFTAEAFLFSFSLPNFYFHAVTAYDILRAKGVPVGKRDYLGRTRTKLE